MVLVKRLYLKLYKDYQIIVALSLLMVVLDQRVETMLASLLVKTFLTI